MAHCSTCRYHEPIHQVSMYNGDKPEAYTNTPVFYCRLFKQIHQANRLSVECDIHKKADKNKEQIL